MRSLRTVSLMLRLGVAAFLVGCGEAQPAPTELEVPDLGSARSALVSSLERWKAGRRDSGVLIGSTPSIGIVDAARADRPLLGYEVVGPLKAVGKARPFSVRLSLGEPSESVEARYLVLGRDPLWVYRQEDFERMLHWEHKMDVETAETPPGSPGGGR